MAGEMLPLIGSSFDQHQLGGILGPLFKKEGTTLSALLADGATYTAFQAMQIFIQSQASAPGNPGAGKGVFYQKDGSDSVFWKANAAGAEIDLGASGAAGLTDIEIYSGSAGGGDQDPAYSSVLNITQGENLTLAIGGLDAALGDLPNHSATNYTASTASMIANFTNIDTELGNLVKTDGSRAFSAVVVGVTPTAANHLSTKGYVDAAIQGVDRKESVRIASAASIADMSDVLLTNFDGTGQGVTLVEGDRVFLKDTASPDGVAALSANKNGIYVLTADGTGASGAGYATLVRSADANTDAEVSSGMFTFVEGGTHANQGWNLITANPIVLDTTNLTFSQFSAAGSFTADETTLTLSGSQFQIKAKGVDLAQMADLTDGQIYIGGSGNTPTRVTVGGDLTADNTGAFSIGADKVTETHIDYASAPLERTVATALVDFSAITTSSFELAVGGLGAVPLGAVITEVRVKLDTVLATAATAVTVGITGTQAKYFAHLNNVDLTNTAHVGGSGVNWPMIAAGAETLKLFVTGGNTVATGKIQVFIKYVETQ